MLKVLHSFNQHELQDFVGLHHPRRHDNPNRHWRPQPHIRLKERLPHHMVQQPRNQRLPCSFQKKILNYKFLYEGFNLKSLLTESFAPGIKHVPDSRSNQTLFLFPSVSPDTSGITNSKSSKALSFVIYT